MLTVKQRVRLVRARCWFTAALAMLAPFGAIAWCAQFLAGRIKGDWLFGVGCIFVMSVCFALVIYHLLTAVNSFYFAGPVRAADGDEDQWEKYLEDKIRDLKFRAGYYRWINLQIRYDNSINASAGGNVITVHTSLAMYDLTDRQYEGVLAHELGHIFLRSGRVRRLARLITAYAMALALMAVPTLHPFGFVGSLLGSMLVVLGGHLHHRLVMRIDERGCDRFATALIGHQGMAEFLAFSCKHVGRRLDPLPEDSPEFLKFYRGLYHRDGASPNRLKQWFALCLCTHGFAERRSAVVKRMVTA